MRRAVFARHGESVCSAAGLLNGDPGNPCPLTELGRGQAQALGTELAAEALDLVVTSPFSRTRETADEATAGRELPRLVVPELGDPRYGVFEGAPIEDYRAWAASARSSEPPPGGGESRYAIVARYVRAFNLLLARPEETLLVVAHSLPLAYLRAAGERTPPRPRVPLADYAVPHRLERDDLARAVGVLEGWLAAPDW